jgi:carbonic anhydrase
MKSYCAVLFSCSLGMVLAAPVLSSDLHWEYAGKAGPTHWAELNPDYFSCNGGKNQSPVDLTGLINAELPPLYFNYTHGPNELLNDGHTVHVHFPPGNTLTLNEHSFELKELHFHTPSEHHIEGRAFPLEGHLVHADAQGNLAVVSLLYQEGAPNPIIAQLWNALPKHPGERHLLMEQITALEFIPPSQSYDFYPGSLTTPPCTEGVEWIVLEQPLSISPQQVHTFMQVIHYPNNRPVQPLNARLVLH